MKGPLVYLITPGEATDASFAAAMEQILSIVRTAVEERVHLVQIREKQLSARRLFELVVEASKITIETHTKLLVNERADIALAAKADGVHLTRGSIPAGVARQTFPAGFLIGASTHSADDVAIAARSGADLVVFGPVFDTPGKGKSVGLSALEKVCRRSGPFPVLALGGVNESNCASAVASGAAGVAGIRSLNDPAKLKAICRKLRG